MSIASQLPSPSNGPLTKGCEWTDGSGGGVQTSIDVMVAIADDARTRLQFTDADLAATVPVTGVGDRADHPKGDPSLTSFNGSGSSLMFCGITTIGTTELVPNQKLTPGSIPDATATLVAQQYGTLCNKIFGSGNTTPTMTAPAPAAAAAASAASTGPTVSTPADGATMPGTSVPLPVGLDCSGSKTAKDTLGQLVCTTTTTTPDANYPYYLKARPAHGFSINHQQETHAGGKEVASMIFTGGGEPGFCFLQVHGTEVTISIQLD